MKTCTNCKKHFTSNQWMRLKIPSGGFINWSKWIKEGYDMRNCDSCKSTLMIDIRMLVTNSETKGVIKWS